MKNPLNIALLIVAIALIGWMIYQNTGSGSSNSVPVEAFNAVGSTISDVAGTDLKIIETVGSTGNVTERGALLDGLKTGTWTTYFPDRRVKTISSYTAGKLHGLYMELNDRGQVELQAFYKEGMLDGPYNKYKQGSRKLEEREYKMDKLHGVYRKYDDLRSKLQQEIHYKDGLQDGPLRYYDQDGNITMEYIYKEGEKVSGGIVETPPAASN